MIFLLLLLLIFGIAGTFVLGLIVIGLVALLPVPIMVYNWLSDGHTPKRWVARAWYMTTYTLLLGGFQAAVFGQGAGAFIVPVFIDLLVLAHWWRNRRPRSPVKLEIASLIVEREWHPNWLTSWDGHR